MRTMADLPMHRVGLPYVGTTRAFLQDPLTFHLAPYRRYGSMYRMHFMGRERLVMAGLEANEFVWQSDHPWDYKAPFGMFRDAYGDKALALLEGDEHRAKRQRLGLAMRPKPMSDLAPVLYKLSVENVDRAMGSTVDLREFCGRAVVHMQSRALFNVPFDENLETEISWIEQFNLFGWFFGPLRHAVWQHPRYRSGTQRIEQLLAQAVDSRLAEPTNDPDLLSVVVRAIHEGERAVPRHELVLELKELTFAGSSTVSNLLGWTLLFLAQRPDWLQDLRDELASFDPTHFSTLHEHPRLMATVLEVERLRPAGAFFPRVAAREFEFQGVRVPAGTHVHHATLVPHFDEDIFDDPTSFRPERFLVGEHPAKWNSVFGGGPHVCLGRPLARVELPLSIAAIVQHADLAIEPVSMRARVAPNLVPLERHIPMRIVPR